MGYEALGILSRGVAGGAKATGEIAEERITSTLDEKKASALEKKQMNMQRLSQEFKKNERVSGQEFTAEQETSRRGYEEGIREEETAREEERYQRRKGEGDTEYERRVAEEEKKYQRRTGEEETAYQRRLEEERSLPVDAEKNYNFMIDVLKIPEADVKSIMTKSYTDTKSGMKKRELYASVYTDLKKAAADSAIDVTPEVDKEMKETAANISGFRPEIGEDDRGTSLTDYIQRIGDLSKREEGPPALEPSHEPFAPVPDDMAPSHEPGGILSGGAEPAGVALPADPKTWEIQFIGQGEDQPFIMIGQEMRMLTPEEYAMYKKETGRIAAGKSLLESAGAKTEI